MPLTEATDSLVNRAMLNLLSGTERIASARLPEDRDRLKFVQETYDRIVRSVNPQHYDPLIILVYALSARLHNVGLDQAVVVRDNGELSHYCGEFIYDHHAHEVRDTYQRDLQQARTSELALQARQPA